MRSESTKGGARSRIAIVSGYGRDQVTPRGQRTRRLMEALEEEWEVALHAMPGGKPSTARPDGSTSWTAALRQRALTPLRRLLLDRWEPWSVRNFGRWRPAADAGLLIAAPWSPVLYASRRLSRRCIPYVVDVGDPWVLTTELMLNPGETLPASPLRRARNAEHYLWEHAAGAVVTTPAQRDALHNLFPDLPIMVRPNGYSPIDANLVKPRPQPADSSVLRIAHFGMLSPTRLDPVPFLEDLQRSGRWKSIVFNQFGDDFGVGLERLSNKSVTVKHHRPIPWAQVVERALEFDAVLVVAYPQPSMMPSKTVEYSTLPLPRIALANPTLDDSTRQYLAGRPAWLVVSNGEPDIGWRVWEHVHRAWTAQELAQPPEDAWPAVAAEVVDFVSTCVAGKAKISRR